MRNLWKYILVGLGVVILEWIFVALSRDFFNGLSQTEAVVIGVGFFLAFELVICTGIILSKINTLKEPATEDRK